MKITIALLRSYAPRAPDAVLQALADQAPRVLHKYGISTPLRMAHFFAQLAHESGGFTIREENLNYSAERMTQVWPSRFPSVQAAAPYAKNPVALANNVYASRMGNGPPSSGDGYKYRGRGLAQHTGKDGYAQIAKITGLPLVEHPETVNDPRHMLECAAAFWQWKNLAPLADADDIVGVTRKWNGGTTGLADRQIWLAKAKRAFAQPLDREAAAGTPASLPPKPATPAPAGPRDPKKDTAVIIAAGAAGGVAAGANAGWGLMEWGIAGAMVLAFGVAGYFALRWWQARKPAEVQPEAQETWADHVDVWTAAPQDPPAGSVGFISPDPADQLAADIAAGAKASVLVHAAASEAVTGQEVKKATTRQRRAKAKPKTAARPKRQAAKKRRA